jgi:hypothetical protein
LYKISCHSTTLTFDIKKRYKEFKILHDWLSKTYPKNEIPKFPPKILIGNMKDEVIEKRRVELEDFLNQCILIDVNYFLFFNFKRKLIF